MPVKIIERAGIAASFLRHLVTAILAIIRHAIYVGTTSGVRLTRQIATVSKQNHTRDIWQLDPLKRISIDNEIPLIHKFGCQPSKQCKIAKHHQTLDMMCVSIFFGLANGLPETVHLRVACPEKIRKRTVGSKKILRSVVRHLQPVDASDKFPPSKDLTDKTLHRVQRRCAGFIGSLHGCNHLART